VTLFPARVPSSTGTDAPADNKLRRRGTGQPSSVDLLGRAGNRRFGVHRDPPRAEQTRRGHGGSPHCTGTSAGNRDAGAQVKPRGDGRAPPRVVPTWVNTWGTQRSGWASLDNFRRPVPARPGGGCSTRGGRRRGGPAGLAGAGGAAAVSRYNVERWPKPGEKRRHESALARAGRRRGWLAGPTWWGPEVDEILELPGARQQMLQSAGRAEGGGSGCPESGLPGPGREDQRCFRSLNAHARPRPAQNTALQPELTPRPRLPAPLVRAVSGAGQPGASRNQGVACAFPAGGRRHGDDHDRDGRGVAALPGQSGKARSTVRRGTPRTSRDRPRAEHGA